MLSEIHYWRDMARVLEASHTELKMPFVEFTVQVLLCSEDDQSLLEEVQKFTSQKERVVKGQREARWNHKYMKIIEGPVKAIE